MSDEHPSPADQLGTAENSGQSGAAERGKPPVGRRFEKGKSANPGGRPKEYKEFMAMTREASITALTKVKLLMLKGRSEAVQLRAAEIIIERAWGKASQPVTGADGGPLDVRFRGAARAVLEAALLSSDASTNPDLGEAG